MRLLSSAFLCLLLSLLLLPHASATDNLSNEESLLAEKMDRFVNEIREKILDNIVRLNGEKNVQTKKFEYENADYVVKVARGDVVQKGGVMVGFIKKPLRSGVEDEVLWQRYIQIDIWPKNPKAGLLHATMNFSYLKKSNRVGGIMDITPGVVIKEDLAFVKAEMDKLFAKHGFDIETFREPLRHGHHKDWLKGSAVGVSFYRLPVLEINEKNFNLVKESVETLFNSYIKVIEKRKDEKFTEKDVDAMYDMRKRWLEKEFLWDPYASKRLVPYEVWSFQDLPPEVRF